MLDKMPSRQMIAKGLLAGLLAGEGWMTAARLGIAGFGACALSATLTSGADKKRITSEKAEIKRDKDLRVTGGFYKRRIPVTK